MDLEKDLLHMNTGKLEGRSGYFKYWNFWKKWRVVASFPVDEDEEVMLVTNKGKLIRLPVNGIRIAGRVTQGVTLLNTEKTEGCISN